VLLVFEKTLYIANLRDFISFLVWNCEISAFMYTRTL